MRLPFYYDITEEQQTRVIETVQTFLRTEASGLGTIVGDRDGATPMNRPAGAIAGIP